MNTLLTAEYSAFGGALGIFLFLLVVIVVLSLTPGNKK
jgi:hypothetical protein